MPNNPTTEANSIFTALTADASFPTITVDIDDTEYDLPSTIGNPLYAAVSTVTVSDLTEKVVDGDGVFDVLMTSMKAHLQEEYDAGRISGQEYTKAYIELVTAVLGNSVQFLIQKDAATYQNALVQMQARTAEIQAIIAKAQLHRERQMLVLTKAQTLTAESEYALAKIRLAVEHIGYTRVESEVAILNVQKTTAEHERDTAGYRLTNILPEEKRQITYQIDYVLPAQVANTVYQTDHILVQQKEVLIKDVALKAYQLGTLFVDQHSLLLEQIETQRAQTLDTRVNGSPIAGAIGKQKELYTQQITSYVQDARYKAAKFWVDGWITQKSLDEGLVAPTEFSNANINTVLASLKSDLDLS
jgi:hypothetical protein